MDGQIDFDSDLGGLDEFAEKKGLEIEPNFSDDGTDDNLDLGGFEDALEEEKPAFADHEIQLDLPDELADISDLSPPKDEDNDFDGPSAAVSDDDDFDLNLNFAKNEVDEFDEPPAAVSDDDDFDDFGLNLNLDDLDGDFSLGSDDSRNDALKEEDDPLGDLSLDDIGLSTEEKPEGAERVAGSETEMDEDLDFSLDLGDLSLGDDK